MTTDTHPLDEEQRAFRPLVEVEPIFARVLTRFGPPPCWRREQGFATLIRIILEQQVSLASAQAAFDRLCLAAGEVTPARFLQFNDQQLKEIGFSRQKGSYGRNLANALLTGTLDVERLPDRDDDSVRSALTSVKGIGIWTANVYLLMAMQRPDIWPSGDIALAAAYQELKGLPARPSNKEMAEQSLAWRPWRSLAARLLYHFYLSTRNRQQHV